MRAALLVCVAACRIGFNDEGSVAAIDASADGRRADATLTNDPCDVTTDGQLVMTFPLGGENLFWPDFRVEWTSTATGMVRISRSLDGVAYIDAVDVADTGSSTVVAWDVSHRSHDHFIRIERVGTPTSCDSTRAKVFVEPD
jgi:hypothetical protein